MTNYISTHILRLCVSICIDRDSILFLSGVKCEYILFWRVHVHQLSGCNCKVDHIIGVSFLRVLSELVFPVVISDFIRRSELVFDSSRTHVL